MSTEQYVSIALIVLMLIALTIEMYWRKGHGQ